MQSEIGSNETCTRGCPRIQAQDCVGHASKEIRFERASERERERERERKRGRRKEWKGERERDYCV